MESDEQAFDDSSCSCLAPGGCFCVGPDRRLHSGSAKHHQSAPRADQITAVANSGAPISTRNGKDRAEVYQGSPARGERRGGKRTSGVSQKIPRYLPGGPHYRLLRPGHRSGSQALPGKARFGKHRHRWPENTRQIE